MADKKIGAGIALDGEAAFKAAIQGINKDMAVLSSEMKKVTAEFDGNANSLAALTSKQEIYKKQVEDQKKKIEELKKALENAKTEYGENSTQVQNWQIKLNNAEAELSKLNTKVEENDKYLEEARTSADGTAKSIDEYGKKTKEAAEDTEKGAASINDLAAALAAAGIAKTVKEIAEAFLEAAKAAATYADEILTLSAQTGISTDDLQKFSYAAELVDVSVETITGSMRRNIKAMYEAQQGSSAYVEAYDKIGISITNADGSLRDSETVYWEIIDALGGMTNEAERDAIAMQILGRSAQDLNPLIKAGAAYMQQLGNEAEAAGYVMSAETLAAAGALDDSFQRLNNSSTALTNTVGAQLAPGLTLLSDAGADVLQWATDFIAENEELVPALAAGTVAVTTYVGAVSAMVIIEKAIKWIKSLDSALVGTASPYFLAAAAVAALVAVIVQLEAKAKEATPEYKKLLDEIEDGRDAYKDASDAIDEESESVGTLISSLTSLNAAENKSAAQKAAMVELVGQLNEAIPGLALAYDQESESVNLTADAIKALWLAQQEQAQHQEDVAYLTDLYTQQAEVATQLTQAQNELILARLNYNAAISETGMDAATLQVYYDEYVSAKTKVDELAAAESGLNAEVAAAEEAVNSFADALGDTGGATEDAAKVLSDLNDGIIDLCNAYAEAKEAALDSVKSQYEIWDTASREVSHSVEDMNAAMQSQIDYWATYNANIESLSGRNIDGLDEMVQSFMDGSDDSVAAIESMSGASDEELSEMVGNWQDLQDEQEKTASSMADLETDFNDKVQQMVDDAAQAVADMALSEEAKASASDTIQGYIDGINNGSSALNSTMYNVALAAWASFEAALGIASPSKVAEEGGENTLDGYIQGVENRQDDLEGVLDETADLIIDAFPDDSDGQALGKKLMDAFADAVDEKAKEITDCIEDIKDAMQDMMDELSDYGDITASTSELEKQTAAIEDYGASLDALKERGASEDLMNQILGMDIEDATAYMDQLLSMSDEAWADYVAAWETKQAVAADIAAKYYAGQLEQTQADFDKLMSDPLAAMAGDAEDAGTNYILGLIAGMQSKEAELAAQAQELADLITETINEALDIHSPSGVAREIMGHFGDGMTLGWDDAMGDLKSRVTADLPSGFYSMLDGGKSTSGVSAGVSAVDMTKFSEAIVNGLSPLVGSGSGGAITINLVMGDKTLANVLYDPLQKVAKQRGVA